MHTYSQTDSCFWDHIYQYYILGTLALVYLPKVFYAVLSSLFNPYLMPYLSGIDCNTTNQSETFHENMSQQKLKTSFTTLYMIYTKSIKNSTILRDYIIKLQTSFPAAMLREGITSINVYLSICLSVCTVNSV